MKTSIAAASGLIWHSISTPEPEELARAVRDIGLSTTDAEFLAQDHQRPEISVREKYITMLVQVPTFNRSLRVTVGVPLHIIVLADAVWSIHYKAIPVLDKLVTEFNSNAEKREEYFAAGSLNLSLQIFSRMYASGFRKLDRLAKHINIAEDAVFQGNERKMVEEIAVLMRDVLDFRKIIRPQTNLFSNPPKHPFLTDEILRQWLRLHGQANKQWEILQSLMESTKELRETNNILVQHKENELLRVLTYYSIIAIPAWILITPFNPRGADSTLLDVVIFWGILLILIITLVVVFLRFKRKRVL